MSRVFLPLFLSSLVLAFLGPALPAEAASREERGERFVPRRVPGGRLPKVEAPPLIGGWRLGTTLTFPYTLGFHTGYLWPAEPVTAKLGASWGLWSDGGLVAFTGSDYRLYGALLYDLAPAVPGGPFVETGLDWVRSSGPVLGLNWPVVPHIGFGTLGLWGEELAWEVTFTATANGLLALEMGLLFERLGPRE